MKFTCLEQEFETGPKTVLNICALL